MNYCKRNVYLTEPQDKALRKIAEKSGLTVSEHLRRIVDEYLARVERK